MFFPEERALRRRILGRVVTAVTRISRDHHVAAVVHRRRHGGPCWAAFLPKQRTVRRRILGGVAIEPVKLVPSGRARHHHIAVAVHRDRHGVIVVIRRAVIPLLPEQRAIRRCILGSVVVVEASDAAGGVTRHHHVAAAVHRYRFGVIVVVRRPVVALFPEQRAVRSRILGRVVIREASGAGSAARYRDVTAAIHHDGIEAPAARASFLPKQRTIRSRILGGIGIEHVTLEPRGPSGRPRHHHIAAAVHRHRSRRDAPLLPKRVVFRIGRAAFLPEQRAIRSRIFGDVPGNAAPAIVGIPRHHHVAAAVHRYRYGAVVAVHQAVIAHHPCLDHGSVGGLGGGE